ncbi:1562_t:CDS:2 [Dentiscutata erythropus]|uniref:1562_t:CDS:1 n=1 Tax=Dentiscutata erythropus TaxID=1348616 RepID=A0A9N8YSE0_9GLOM|nr:1562_t:CDS:2 [Dentiscutata erythropus]
MELPASVKNLELPDAVKNIELPSVVKNVPNVVMNVPTVVRNNVPNVVKNIQVPININAQMFSSFATSAFTSVTTLTKSIQQKVEETTKDMQQQHQELMRQVKEETLEPKAGTEAVPPWIGLPNEEELKERILALSQDKRNFTIPPPENTNFQFDINIYSRTAMATLKADSRLNQMRFELVPKINYFYRVSLIKQTALGSIDGVVLENEVFSKNSTEISESMPNNLEMKKEDKENHDLSNKEVIFDATKDEDAWIEDFESAAALVGSDGDAIEPENWEEELKKQISST